MPIMRKKWVGSYPYRNGKNLRSVDPNLIEWMSEQKGGKIPKRPPQLKSFGLLTPSIGEDFTRTLEELSDGQSSWISIKSLEPPDPLRQNKEKYLPVLSQHQRAYPCYLSETRKLFQSEGRDCR